MSTVALNLEHVREALIASCERAGRNPAEVTLMAVTKNHPREAVLEAIAAGQRLFGENRVQEAVEKYTGLDAEYELHMIGHLQRNKTRDAVGCFHAVQSIDKLSTAERLSAFAVECGRVLDILLEMNTSGEETKSGVKTMDDLKMIADSCAALEGLNVRGLMTLAPFTDDPGPVRQSFRTLKGAFETIRSTGMFRNWNTLSMGMSSDYTIAVEEGSTMVRIGTAIFGER